jgi:hypothetical protein
LRERIQVENVQRSTFNVQRSTFNVQRSKFDVRRRTQDLGRAALGARERLKISDIFFDLQGIAGGSFASRTDTSS